MGSFLQEQNRKYSFFLASDMSSAILITAYIFIIILIIVCICKQITRMRREHKSIFTVVQTMYMFLMLWCIFDIVEGLTSLWLYFWHIFTQDKNAQFVKVTQQVSMFLFMITFSSIFLEHTALILAPYHWHEIVVKYFQCKAKERLVNSSHSSLIEDEVKNQINELKNSWDSRINKTIRWSIPIRQIIIIIWFISTVMLITQIEYTPKQVLSFISCYLVILDSFLILLLFTFGRCSIHKNKNLLKQLQHQQIKRIKLEYNIWIFSIAFRFLFFLLRTVLPPKYQGISFHDCDCCSTGFKLFPFVFLSVQMLFVDLLLATVILWMYWIKDNKHHVDHGIEQVLYSQ